jgi:hypothetical protein
VIAGCARFCNQSLAQPYHWPVLISVCKEQPDALTMTSQLPLSAAIVSAEWEYAVTAPMLALDSIRYCVVSGDKISSETKRNV